MSHVTMSAGNSEDGAVTVCLFNPFQLTDQDIEGLVPAYTDKLTLPSVLDATFSTRLKANRLERV